MEWSCGWRAGGLGWGMGYIGWGLDGGGEGGGGRGVLFLFWGGEKVGVRRLWWVMGKLDEGGWVRGS